MKNICAIVSKQIKDTLKNKAILIQFVMLPLIGAIFESTIKLENMPDDARKKLGETLERIVNEGSGGLICILL